MTKQEIQVLKQVLTLKESSLHNVLVKFLDKHYKDVVETPKYIYAIGDIPVALVAHMDTVFPNPPDEIFYDEKQQVLISPQGLGADDRAGIFAILQIIKSGLRPHVIFTTDEEVGGLGAAELSKIPCPFPQLDYIIELDRQGQNDCVFYDCNNPEFEEYIQSFGFEWNWGTYTDICELCPKWGVAGVNLSVGYRDEHTYSETLFLKYLQLTINKVKIMLVDSNMTYYKYIPTDFSRKPASFFSKSIHKCAKCGKYHFEENLMPVVKNADGGTDWYCYDCLDPTLGWCEVCGQAFEQEDHKYTSICPKCRKEILNGTQTAN